MTGISRDDRFGRDTTGSDAQHIGLSFTRNMNVINNYRPSGMMALEFNKLMASNFLADSFQF